MWWSTGRGGLAGASPGKSLTGWAIALSCARPVADLAPPRQPTPPNVLKEESRPMKKLFAVAALVVLAACAGEKPAPATPAADTTATAPAADTTAAAPAADSTMARDTAKKM